MTLSRTVPTSKAESPSNSRFSKFFLHGHDLSANGAAAGLSIRQADAHYIDLDRFSFPASTTDTYATVIRGLLLAGKMQAAKVFRSRMYASRDENGLRLYRFGEHAGAEKALSILASMERMEDKGERSRSLNSSSLGSHG